MERIKISLRKQINPVLFGTFFVCGLFLAATISAQKSDSLAPNGGGTFYTVSGNVQANNVNLEDATVVLIYNGSVTESATTGADGNYSLNALENFSYRISVYKNGFNFNPAFQTITEIQTNQTINFQNGEQLCVPAPFGQTGENYCQTAVVTPISAIQNGRIAYEVFGSAFAVDADGTNQAQLPPGGAFPSWSPDGTKVLYNRDPSNDIGFDQEIFVMNADGSSNRQLTANPWSEFRARWSPNGERIIFERLVNSSDIGIYTMDADGENETRLTALDVIAQDASFSPDGTKIVYTVVTEIFVMNADGSDSTQLTSSGENFQSIEPSWSPDGLHIVFSSNRLGFGNEIWRMTAQGGSLVQLTSEADLDHRTPVYSPDGTKIVFSRSTSAFGFRELYTKQLFGGTAQRLTFTLQQANAESPFNSLRIFHNENGALFDRTASRDFTMRRICAEVSSLSPFVVAAPLAPTAANVSISGKVTASTGESLVNAEVILIDSLGNSRKERTSSFGFYRFEGIAAGQVYVFQIRKKRYQFNSQVITINEEISELNFTAEP